MAGKPQCTVTDGRFVEPCDGLEGIIDDYAPGFSRAKKGVFKRSLTNMKTGQPSRSMVGIKTKRYPNGILFNCCPFCGKRIDAPFLENEADT